MSKRDRNKGVFYAVLLLLVCFVFAMDGTLLGERFPTYFNDWLFIQRALYDESYHAPDELKPAA